MVNAKENKMTGTALTQAEKVARREQRAAEREAQEARDNERREVERKERMEKMPGILFNLMLRAEMLRRAGMQISCNLHNEIPKSMASNSDHVGKVGLVFVIDHRAKTLLSEDWNEEVSVSIDAASWEVESIENKLNELQDEADERLKRKALADEAKKLLTPDQLAALREFS